MFRHVLRQKYANKKKLRDILNYTFGAGNYQVTITEKHWILYLPTQLNEADLAEIERQIRVHYSAPT